MVTAKYNGTEVEIRTLDELVDALKEAKADSSLLVLQVDEEEIVLKATPLRRARRTKEERETSDEEAFLSAAGSWEGHLDAEEFKRQIKAARGSHRPFVEVSLPEE